MRIKDLYELSNTYSNYIDSDFTDSEVSINEDIVSFVREKITGYLELDKKVGIYSSNKNRQYVHKYE